jgi:integrase
MEIIASARMGRDPETRGPTAPSQARATEWTDDREEDEPIAVGLGDDAPAHARQLRNAAVSELYELYLREGPNDKPLKRESSWQVDRKSYHSHVKPLIGSAKARALRPTDLAAFQAAVAEGKSASDRRTGKHGRSMVRGGRGAAVRAMRTLSAIFSWAVWREFMDSNPATRDQKLRETPRDRPITTEEAQRLWKVLDEAQSAWVIAPTYADMIRLIMLTGARRNEVAELAWSEVDLANGRLLLPPVRTKMGVLNKARTIVLSEPAREIIARQPRQSMHVFPSTVDGKPAVGINKAWLKARTLAGLEDVRLHDLRQSFATFAVEDGASLFLADRALGHRSAVSTERYAHPRDAAAHEIAAKIAARILQTTPGVGASLPQAAHGFAAALTAPQAANNDFDAAISNLAPWLS